MSIIFYGLMIVLAVSAVEKRSYLALAAVGLLCSLLMVFTAPWVALFQLISTVVITFLLFTWLENKGEESGRGPRLPIAVIFIVAGIIFISYLGRQLSPVTAGAMEELPMIEFLAVAVVILAAIAGGLALRKMRRDQ